MEVRLVLCDNVRARAQLGRLIDGFWVLSWVGSLLRGRAGTSIGLFGGYVLFVVAFAVFV
jgi:hypothetical protein